MALYSLASAKGSPGVTVLAAALCAVWASDPILADLDPAGGDIAWRYRTADGRLMDQQRGLLSLGADLRRGSEEVDLQEHLQDAAGGLRVLAGLASPGQAVGLGPAWSQLPRMLAVPGTDVIADCGRVVPGSPTLPVLAGSDAVLFVVRPTIEGIAHLRGLIRTYREQSQRAAVESVPVGVAVVTDYRDARAGADLQQLLDAEDLGARVLGIVAEDHKAAEVLAGRRSAAVKRSLLVRSVTEIATGLSALASTRKEVVR